MSLRDYIGTKALSLCMAGIAGLYLILVLCFCGIPRSLLLILLLSGVLVAAVCTAVGWRRTDRRLRMLKSRLDALPEKYLIGETLDRPRDALELEYYLLMQEISRSAIGAVEQARADKQDYCNYVERWVHEIKTPLTACSLILANGAEPAKLRTAEKDTQISLADLRAVCHQAVREEMELLIAADISVFLDGAASVYTDPKLLVFLLKQLLINCAKYCPGCQIRMGLVEGCLTFEDNGPGIPAQELNRVTERGFTGAAGRSHGQSTGMGLYIVSELCEKLNIDLQIASEELRFTRFTLRFPA